MWITVYDCSGPNADLPPAQAQSRFSLEPNVKPFTAGVQICFPMLPHALMIAAVRLAARKSEAPWQPQQPVSPWQHEPRQILTLLRSIADMAGANYSMPTAELQTHIVGAIASLKEVADHALGRL